MNRIMKQKYREALLLLPIILMTGCVKEPLYNTPHPETGAVRVITDWSEISTDATQSENYYLRIGELTHAVNGTVNLFKHLLSEGTHSLLMHNIPTGITIDGTKGRINTLPDGTIEPLPGFLFSTSEELHILKDDTLVVKAKMRQSLHTLQLVLQLKEGDNSKITATSATLSSVVRTIDLTTGKPDATQAGANVKPTFQLGTLTPTRSETAPALIATMRLAGVAEGEPQKLTVVITLKGGTLQTIETDLTEALKNFGNSVQALQLHANMEISSEAGFTGSITDWTPGNGADGESGSAE